jgi:hypothetical protein
MWGYAMKRPLFLLTAIFFTTNVLAQHSDSSKTYTSLKLAYQAGSVLQTHEFLQGENATGQPIDYFQSLRFEYARQTDGSNIWHQVFNYPSYGIGIWGANFFNEGELGTPSAIFGFLSWPFHRFEKSYFSLEFGFGLAYDWQEFDLETNPYNLTIGAARSAYIDVGARYRLEIANRWDLGLGISFTHASNGSTQQPNSGINLFAPRLDLTYHSQKERPKFIKSKIPEYQPQYEWFIFPTYGSKSEIFVIKNATDSLGKTREAFPVVQLITGVSRQISYKSKVGLLTDLSYNESLEVWYEEVDGQVIKHEGDSSDKLRWGLSTFYELAVSSFSAHVGVGYYLIGEGSGDQKKLYQRIGVRYHMIENLFAGISMRISDFNAADHMEFSIGYRTIINL